MSSIKKYNVFIYGPEYSLIGEYLDRNEALKLFYDQKFQYEMTGSPFVDICEVTVDYLKKTRKEKLEKINALQRNF